MFDEKGHCRGFEIAEFAACQMQMFHGVLLWLSEAGNPQ